MKESNTITNAQFLSYFCVNGLTDDATVRVLKFD